MSKKVFQSKPDFIEIRCSEPNPFYFARRKGKNSIGVLIYDRNTKHFLIRFQPLVHTEDGDSKELFPCPITGSLEYQENPYEAAIREVEEETGYELDGLISLGSYIVGTQTDEIVYLYFADVTGLTPNPALQDGTFHEEISENRWISIENLNKIILGECYSGLLISFYRSLPFIE